MATPEDREALAHLAALDSTHPPSGPVLVAEVEGELQAALSVSDHTVIADPFQSTAHLVERLHEHAAELAD